MNDQFNHWLGDKLKLPGVMACVVRAPDRKIYARTHSTQFKPVGLEHACRCMADAFQILQTNHFPTNYIRWVYEKNFVYGAIRPDGICLALVTKRQSSGLPPKELEEILSEFQCL